MKSQSQDTGNPRVSRDRFQKLLDRLATLFPLQTKGLRLHKDSIFCFANSTVFIPLTNSCNYQGLMQGARFSFARTVSALGEPGLSACASIC